MNKIQKDALETRQQPQSSCQIYRVPLDHPVTENDSMNWNIRGGRRAYNVISAWVWDGALHTGGKATVGFGLLDWNVKKKQNEKSIPTLHPPYVAFLEMHPTAFQILLQLFYLYPFKMMDTKLGGCWSLLRWCKILTLPCKLSKNSKNWFLGSFPR